MITYTIYIVDDEEIIKDGISMALESDYRVKTFTTAESALKAINKSQPDLVLLDIGLPGMSGIEALEEIKNLYPEILIIMITAFEDIQAVISAMKFGAYDYVVKPIHMDALRVTIKNALDSITLRKEVQNLQNNYLKEHMPCFISESDAIQDVIEFIEMVAKSPDTPILIRGETGTGKELLARAIHFRSPNFKGPLMTVNCAAIPKDLIESELFGYEKGAFSGAKESGKKGLIEEATDGTLFLDEIGDLSPEAQAKLLRFLENGEFYRVGGTRKIQIQTRIVSATNKDLDHMIEKGAFRKDLYFRLGVINIQVPTLNERPDDIVPLAKHFLYEFNRKFDKNLTGISAPAEEVLKTHKWTGNVRELKNLFERAVLISKGSELSVKDIGLKGTDFIEIPKAADGDMNLPLLADTGIDLSALQESIEAYYIREALKRAGGNESKAAKYLNMNHHTFRYRRKKLLIEYQSNT